MGKWTYLSHDILEIVFYYIGSQKKISSIPEKHVILPTKDILQCQLTCKHWKSLAQSTYYSYICLNSLRQSIAFANTLFCNNKLGSLIKYIYFKYICSDQFHQKTVIIPLLNLVAYSSLDLKRIYCKFELGSIFLETIRKKRMENRFLKLETIPYSFNRNGYNMEQYNMTANLFYQSLRELVIHDSYLKLYDHKKRLKSFLNIDTLYFILLDFTNIYVVDKYISECSTVKSIYIQNSGITNTMKLWSTSISHSTHTCHQVEKVEVSNILFDIRIYKYLMGVVPNVKNLKLQFTPIPKSTDQLPVDTALQYLHYLIKIPYVQVNYIPLENFNDTMLGFFDSSNTIKKLDFTYNRLFDDASARPRSFLIIESKTYTNINIVASYTPITPNGSLFLPCIGLIKKSGNNLQYLKINMDLCIADTRKIADSQEKPDLISYIINRCTNLKSIHLWFAFLYIDESCSLFDMKPIFSKVVELFHSFIHPSFLSGLSCYVSSIKTFIISNCKFTNGKQNRSNVSIDMPNTEFGSIKYEDYIQAHHILLTLTTTFNNETVWYHGTEDSHKICNELDYTETLLSKESCLLVFIQCKGVGTVEIRSSGFSLSLNT